MITATDLEFAEVPVAAALAVQMPGQCASDPAAISAAMRAGFASVMGFVGRHALRPNGHPRAIYTAYDAKRVSFVAALPVAAGPAGPVSEPPIRVETLPAANAYRFTHRGPYASMPQTYGQITAFLKETLRMESEPDWTRYMPMWEEYQNDPEKTLPSELMTYIYLPLPGRR